MSILADIFENNQKGMEEKEKEIFSHLAWYGNLSGMECEELLRGLAPGSYLLREGERKFQYYLSFVIGDSFTFKHQPFLITMDNFHPVWGYRNGCHHWASRIEKLIPLILHCTPEECYPVQRRADAK